jgi:exocyst complex component 7
MPEQAMDGSTAELEGAERVVMWWDSSSASVGGSRDEPMLFDGVGGRAKAEPVPLCRR